MIASFGEASPRDYWFPGLGIMPAEAPCQVAFIHFDSARLCIFVLF